MRLNQFCLYVVIFVLAGGCSGENFLPEVPDEEYGERAERLVVRVAPQEYIDSAQVFFFRPKGSGDTLIAREMIYGIDALAPRSFAFDLPAGMYNVWVFGNVPTDCVRATPPYSSDDIYFDYSDRGEAGVVGYGRRAITVGVDTATVMGMLLLSGYVELTIRQVPAGVDRIIVTLGNTSAGLTLKAGYLPQPMDPPLTDTLYDVRAGGTYESDFYCFPPSGQGGVSTLDVKCLGADGRVLYSGRASAWQLRPGYDYKISCSFGSRGRVAQVPDDGGVIFFGEGEE